MACSSSRDHGGGCWAVVALSTWANSLELENDQLASIWENCWRDPVKSWGKACSRWARCAWKAKMVALDFRYNMPERLHYLRISFAQGLFPSPRKSLPMACSMQSVLSAWPKPTCGPETLGIGASARSKTALKQLTRKTRAQERRRGACVDQLLCDLLVRTRSCMWLVRTYLFRSVLRFLRLPVLRANLIPKKSGLWWGLPSNLVAYVCLKSGVCVDP